MVKYTLWGNEVELDLSKKTFPTDEEMKEMEDVMLNCEHGYFDGSERHDHKLHYRKWSPVKSPTPVEEGEDTPSSPKGVCVFQHGIHGDSGAGAIVDGTHCKLSLLAKTLMDSGYILYSLDMLGHGYSEGTRFFIPDGDWTVNRDDFQSFAKFVEKEEDPDLPFYLLGESYGACLTLHVARQWLDAPDTAPKNFRSICVLAPGMYDFRSASYSSVLFRRILKLKTLSTVPIACHVLLLIAIIGDIPSPPVVTFLTSLAYVFPQWTPFFMPDPVTPERIWRNEKVREIFISDRQKEMYLTASSKKFCLGTGLGLLNALDEVRATAIPGFSAPFYVAHGTKDYGVPLEGTEFLVEHSTTGENDRCVKIIEDGYHCLLSEENRLETAKSLVDWMDSRLSKPVFTME